MKKYPLFFLFAFFIGTSCFTPPPLEARIQNIQKQQLSTYQLSPNTDSFLQKYPSPFQKDYALHYLNRQERREVYQDSTVPGFLKTLRLILKTDYQLSKAKQQSIKRLIQDVSQGAREMRGISPHATFALYELSFTTEAKTSYLVSRSRSVNALYYKPAGLAKSDSLPAVVILTHFWEDLSRPLSLFFVKNGFHVLELNAPLFGKRGPPELRPFSTSIRMARMNFTIEKYRDFIEQAALDALKATHWLMRQKNVDPTRMSTLGHSKMGHLAALTYVRGEGLYHKWLGITPMVHPSWALWKSDYFQEIHEHFVSIQHYKEEEFHRAFDPYDLRKLLAQSLFDPDNFLLSSVYDDSLIPVEQLEELKNILHLSPQNYFTTKPYRFMKWLKYTHRMRASVHKVGPLAILDEILPIALEQMTSPRKDRINLLIYQSS